MAADGETRRPGWPRWAAVCALLLGLFLMHGAPMSADGCHGAMAAALPMGHPAAAAMTGPAMAAAPTPAPARPAAQHAAAADPSGAMCLSTPAPRGVALPAVLLLAVLVVGMSAPMPGASVRWWARGRRRAPPRAGRELLLRVCVART